MTAAYNSDGDLRAISKGMFRIVSDHIGPKSIVDLKRQTWTILDAIKNCNTIYPYSHVMSGSKAEGFNLNSSDYDLMLIDRNVIVLHGNCDSYISSFTSSFPTVLFMETENVSPGFAFLRCLKYDYRNDVVHKSLVLKGNEVYLSNYKVRETFMVGGPTTVHGPCISGFLFYGGEYDIAYTLTCPSWPEQAASFLQRSLCRGWPDRELLTKICNDGCLIVPINSKQPICDDQTELEWRISFSRAEKKLIFSMNHSQFLCYGLLKLFLNEVLLKIQEIKELFCSYFMKTAVFWEICENKESWTPHTFLFKVWSAFRRIVKWTAMGYCPNFFIPENNMFFGKIFGASQRNMMVRLRSLYDEGYLCLLRCTSLSDNLHNLISQPVISNVLSINEEDYVPLQRLELEKVLMICISYKTPSNAKVSEHISTLSNIACLDPLSLSDAQKSGVKLSMSYTIQRLALKFHSLTRYRYSANKYKYMSIRNAKSLLRKTKSTLHMSEIHRASCSYINGEYSKTIQIIDYIKNRLQRQPFMYTWRLDGEMILMYRQQGLSYDVIMNSFILDWYEYEPTTSFDELYLEHYFSIRTIAKASLYIPPFVYLNFLLILSHVKLNIDKDTFRILRELETFLLYDEDFHIPKACKAISWEILGFCQQLCGDCRRAYQSYMKALNDDYNYFKPVTIARINSL